jgi:hypothetical protein
LFIRKFLSNHVGWIVAATAGLVTMGCLPESPPEVFAVPAPQSLEWTPWWNEVTAATGLSANDVQIRRLWLKYNQNRAVTMWELELALNSKESGQLILLRGQGNRVEVLRTAQSGVTGLAPHTFWADVNRLPAHAWPGPNGQIQVAPASEGVQFGLGRYSVHVRKGDAWIALPSGERHTTVPAEWEARVSNAKAEATAFWFWTPD